MGRINENTTELDAGNDESGEYQVEAICDSVFYIRESEKHLPELYYLFF